MIVSGKSARQDGMMMVSEATALLGLTTETIRNWDDSGKLVPLRNPLRGYRYDMASQPEAFLKVATAGRERGW